MDVVSRILCSSTINRFSSYSIYTNHQLQDVRVKPHKGLLLQGSSLVYEGINLKLREPLHEYFDKVQNNRYSEDG